MRYTVKHLLVVVKCRVPLMNSNQKGCAGVFARLEAKLVGRESVVGS